MFSFFPHPCLRLSPSASSLPLSLSLPLISAFVSLPSPHPYLCLYSSLLQTVHLKTSRDQRKKDEESGKTPLTVVPSYTNTGYDMRQLALDARDQKKKSK
jgi:hypothetical protein